MCVAMNNKKLSLSGRKVLVVDDEEEILVITRLMLELHGAEVITSLTAAEGLEQVQTQRLDLIKRHQHASDGRVPVHSGRAEPPRR